MKLCVFQGTFNPFHNAHIRLAEYTINKYNFDSLLFIPAYKPPHKKCDESMAMHRLNMTKLAVNDVNNPKFDVSDIEYQRNEKSYTYITICELYKIYKPEGKIHFIIGTDAFNKIESWYESDKLKDILKFIVFERENNFDFDKYEYLNQNGYDFITETLEFNDISSTELRELIKNGKDYTNYVNIRVKEYIENYGLYKI